LSPCLTKHYAMKAYWGRGGIAPRILKLGTRWSTSPVKVKVKLPLCLT